VQTPTTTTPVAALADRLRQLEAETASAALEGLTDSAYLADLQQEIAEHRAAYVGAAVTEIAVLRAELSGPLLG
jgi:hypothetical protein